MSVGFEHNSRCPVVGSGGGAIDVLDGTGRFLRHASLDVRDKPGELCGRDET